MGTNIYMCRRITDNIKKQLEDLVYQRYLISIQKIDKAETFVPNPFEYDEYDSEDSVVQLNNQIKDLCEEIHIGKRSGGWEFLFAPNPKYYENTRESIDKFLHNPDYIIYTEYDEEITPEIFWNEYYTSEGFNLKTYYEQHPQDRRYWIDPDQEEFESDGLRFSKRDDFS